MSNDDPVMDSLSRAIAEFRDEVVLRIDTALEHLRERDGQESQSMDGWSVPTQSDASRYGSRQEERRGECWISVLSFGFAGTARCAGADCSTSASWHLEKSLRRARGKA